MQEKTDGARDRMVGARAFAAATAAVRLRGYGMVEVGGDAHGHRSRPSPSRLPTGDRVPCACSRRTKDCSRQTNKQPQPPYTRLVAGVSRRSPLGSLNTARASLGRARLRTPTHTYAHLRTAGARCGDDRARRGSASVSGTLPALGTACWPRTGHVLRACAVCELSVCWLHADRRTETRA